MANSLLSTESLINSIKSLKINKEQEQFLLNELPKMTKKEKSDLLEMLKKVRLLNDEEKQAIENVKSNW